MKQNLFKGTAASPGIIIGDVFIFDSQKCEIEKTLIPPKDVPLEIKKFKDAIEVSKNEVLKIKEAVNREIGETQAAIFNFHYLMLDDPQVIKTAIEIIEKENVTAEYAIQTTFDKIISNLSQLDNAYIKERQSDYRDICLRVIGNLSGIKHKTLVTLDKKVIVVAHDLSPSDTANMDKSKVLGFAVEMGGPTSHTVIMAKALEIPAVVGINNIVNFVKNGDKIIVDGTEGIVIVNPDNKTLKKYQIRKYEFETVEKSLFKLVQLKAKTLDGYEVKLAANIELPDEIEHVKKHGVKGIGLFRTEFLFLRKADLPTEEEQFEEYKKVVKAMAPDPVIIRTFDLGGDKFISRTAAIEELNPFLGLRAIRLSLKFPDMFKTQLRAILRASVYGNVKILFPMISGIEEIRKAKGLVESVRQELKNKIVPFDENIKIGIMIEIPSAALTADSLAQEVDFFSIGTNDLIQYMLAVDRGNEKVSYLYNPLHPSILKLIKYVIDSGHNNKIWVGVCGEMAAEPVLAFILIGLGVDELSMSSLAIPDVKRMIRNIRLSDAKTFADKILKLSDPNRIRKEAERALLKLIPDMVLT